MKKGNNKKKIQLTDTNARNQSNRMHNVLYIKICICTNIRLTKTTYDATLYRISKRCNSAYVTNVMSARKNDWNRLRQMLFVECVRASLPNGIWTIRCSRVLLWCDVMWFDIMITSIFHLYIILFIANYFNGFFSFVCALLAFHPRVHRRCSFYLFRLTLQIYCFAFNNILLSCDLICVRNVQCIMNM